MIKAFFFIFEPVVAWTKVAKAQRSIGFILMTYLVPTLLLVAGVEGWGLAKWGKWLPGFQKFKDFTRREIYFFEGTEFVLSLLMVFIIALLIRHNNQTFRKAKNLLPSFTIAAYALSPLFLLRLLDAIPTVNPWVSWGLGVVLTIWVLYQGLPRILQPDPVHAFGLYLSSAMVVLLTTGVMRLLTALYLMGDVDLHHSWLTRPLANWLSQ